MDDTTPPLPESDDRLDEMSDEDKRRDQLLAAPDAVESDADPRIAVTEHDGVTRVDILPDADVRPGNPFEEPADEASVGDASGEARS